MTTDRAFGPAKLTGAHWRKSAYSANSGACVEVTELSGGHRAMRDSKNPTGPVLILPLAGWSAFTAGIRSGEFD